MDVYTFTAILEKFNSRLWAYHIIVPEAVSQVFISNKAKRVVCTLHEKVDFQCALMPKGDGRYFININKKLRDQLRLKLNDPVLVTLRKDESEYGLPMPEELAELLNQDPEGNAFFQALSPGKTRNLLYIVGMVKNPDLRIERALIVLEHLKDNQGKIDFRALNTALKKNG